MILSITTAKIDFFSASGRQLARFDSGMRIYSNLNMYYSFWNIIIKNLKGGFVMFHNLKRDFSKTLKQQIKEGTSKGWTYIGVFGRGENAILKFISES